MIDFDKYKGYHAEYQQKENEEVELSELDTLIFRRGLNASAIKRHIAEVERLDKEIERIINDRS